MDERLQRQKHPWGSWLMKGSACRAGFAVLLVRNNHRGMPLLLHVQWPVEEAQSPRDGSI